ncbi:unnamed protein product [Closterium sp. NIES-65]|nr:unnamed protein product [Closterium sp. NIES-65]
MAICCLGSVSNYLIGTVPALVTGLRTLDLRLNFLTDLPVVAYFWCGGSTKCLASLSKYSSAGTAQHPVAECAYCGTSSVPPLCWGAGAVCSVNASAAVAAGTVSSSLQLVLPCTCVGSPVVGLKDTAVWRSVMGAVGVVVPGAASTGPIPPFLSFPTRLSPHRPSLTPSPDLAAPWATTTSKGAFPAVPATTNALDIQSNFLSAAFPTNMLTYCAATTNCLTNANNYASLGIAQRSAADCAICGTDSGQGKLCGGVPCLVNTTRVTAPITASSPTRNLYYTPVAMDANTSEWCSATLTAPFSAFLPLVSVSLLAPAYHHTASSPPTCSNNFAGAGVGAGSDGRGLVSHDGGAAAQGAKGWQRAHGLHRGRLHGGGASSYALVLV